MNVTLRQIECFTAVAELLHFGRAAQRANMTQPALSRQVAALEQALGVRLLVRGDRAVRLTPAGAAFLGGCRKATQVLRSACRDLQRIIEHSGQPLRMAVNVSVAQFRQTDFLATLEHALEESGIDPGLLELEITESVAMLDASFMIDLLNRIKGLGVSLAVDDFGTGFSSLSYLERLNVDRLKIDLSFVRQMEQSDGSKRIVETIIQLGRSLQLELIAEGIEQESQAASLTQMGCHEGQGYLFAKPLELAALLSFISAPQP